jgi:hypothetical protein
MTLDPNHNHSSLTEAPLYRSAFFSERSDA